MQRLKVFVPTFTMIVAAAASFCGGTSFASEDHGNRPPNAVAGECWCLYTTPAQYKTVTEQFMVAPESCSYEVIPAVYEMRSDRVCVRKESSRQIKTPAVFGTENYQALVTGETCRTETIDAVFENRDERVCVSKASQRRINIPAVYKTENYEVCIAAARSEWRQTNCEAQPLNASADAKDVKGECWCLVAIPAKSETRTRQVIAEPARCEMETIPAEYKMVTKQVCVSPKSSRKIAVPAVYETRTREVCIKSSTCSTEVIPAEYKNVEKQVCVKEASKRKIAIPARYEARSREVLVSPATKGWRKTSCEANSKVSSL